MKEYLYAPQSATAKILGINVATLQKWVDLQPSYAEGRKKFYYLPESVAFKEARQENNNAQLDLQAERAKLAHAQTQKVELEVEILKKNLLPRDEVALYWGGMVEAMKARLLAIPTKSAQVAITCTEIHEIEKEVRILVYEALQEIAKYGIPDISPGIVDSGNAEQSETTAKLDGKPVGGRREKAKRGGKRGTRPVENR